MADSSLVAGLLGQAGNVFSLAGKLGRAFEKELHARRQPSAKVAPWSKHAVTFNEFRDSVLVLRDAIASRPHGFEPVAAVLRQAGELARIIEAAPKWSGGPTPVECLELWPELNSVLANGHRAAAETARAVRGDDRWTFLDGGASALVLAEATRKVRQAIDNYLEEEEESGCGEATYSPELEAIDKGKHPLWRAVVGLESELVQLSGRPVLPDEGLTLWKRLLAESRRVAPARDPQLIERAAREFFAWIRRFESEQQNSQSNAPKAVTQIGLCLTVAQVAALAGVSVKTVNNRLSAAKDSAPKPVTKRRGAQPATFRYADVRKWAVEQWRNRAMYFPESAAEAEKILARNSADAE